MEYSADWITIYRLQYYAKWNESKNSDFSKRIIYSWYRWHQRCTFLELVNKIHGPSSLSCVGEELDTVQIELQYYTRGNESENTAIARFRTKLGTRHWSKKYAVAARLFSSK